MRDLFKWTVMMVGIFAALVAFIVFAYFVGKTAFVVIGFLESIFK